MIDRVDAHIRRHALIEPRGEVLCLVSGGADSTCLFHVLRELGYRVSALHVDHGLRGRESDDDAAWCAERFGAEVVRAEIPRTTEAELRDVRYSFRPELLRATGHTLSDQVETILFRLVSSGSTKGIKVRREDGVVRPLLCLWREDTEAYCRERGLEWRVDSTNAATARGLIREQVLPLLERIHPAARENVLRALESRQTLSRGAPRQHRLGLVAYRIRAARPYSTGMARRRSSCRPQEEDPRRVRRRKDPALRPRRLAARGAR